MTYRILITGSREGAPVDRAFVWTTLTLEARARGEIVVVHGACPTGVDAFADEWAKERPGYVTTEPYPADGFGAWPACGPRRNAYMVALGADLCLGFPGRTSKGTWDCLRKAVAAGIKTKAYSLPGGAS